MKENVSYFVIFFNQIQVTVSIGNSFPNIVCIICSQYRRGSLGLCFEKLAVRARCLTE